MEEIIRDIASNLLIRLKAIIFSQSSGVKPPFQQWVFKSFNKLIRWTMGEREYGLALARGIERLEAECLKTAKSD